jgi:hypothetical protein
MPTRKLSVEKVAALKADYDELSQWDGGIIRTGPDGVAVAITSTEGLATFHGISKSRLFELRRNDWRLGRQGPPVAEGETVSVEVFKTLYEMSLDQIRQRDQRIAELEDKLKEQG